MKRILEGAGFLLLLGGGCGVLRELTGWFTFLGFTRFLTEGIGVPEDQVIFANVVVAVVGFALLMIGDRMR
ncbi:hypothetical protein [Streptomyces sp. NPDC001985]|uniref:hypothetical protein n=1 Tax=Streptomyces sp. NPDC001985 TaxID=3154406 RepID=UPI00332312F4